MIPWEARKTPILQGDYSRDKMIPPPTYMHFLLPAKHFSKSVELEPRGPGKRKGLLSISVHWKVAGEGTPSARPRWANLWLRSRWEMFLPGLAGAVLVRLGGEEQH